MREPEAPTILACGHVEVRSGHCATTDCENYDRMSALQCRCAEPDRPGWAHLRPIECVPAPEGQA